MRKTWFAFGAFAALSLLWLLAVPGLQVAFGVPSLNFDAMARAAAEETGVRWTSNLLAVLRLSVAEPALLLLIVGSAAPTLAALTMLAVSNDRAAWRQFFRRFHPFGTARAPSVNDVIYSVAVIAAIILCLLVAFELRHYLAANYPRDALSITPGVVLSLLIAAFLDQGALLEEPGWRAYATPLLMRSGSGPLAAAVVVGIVWGLWHIPRDVITGVIDRLGLIEYGLLYLPSFLLGTVSVSIIATFLMQRFGGSVVPAILVHGLTNDAAGLAGTANIEQALTTVHQLTKAWCCRRPAPRRHTEQRAAR